MKQRLPGHAAEFRKSGMSDTEMLQAALAWAHKQPDTGRSSVPARQSLENEGSGTGAHAGNS